MCLCEEADLQELALQCVLHSPDSNENQVESLIFRLGGVKPLDADAVNSEIRTDQESGPFPI